MDKQKPSRRDPHGKSQKPKYRDKIDEFIAKNWKKLTNTEIAAAINRNISRVQERAAAMGLPNKNQLKYTHDVNTDKIRVRERNEGHDLNKKYKQLIGENARLEKELKAALHISHIDPVEIQHKVSSGKSEVTAVVLASDWHIEERVKPEKVNNVNRYNLEVAEKRSLEFFQNTLKLVKKEQYGARIDDLVLALLGDFISGNIHDELLENCEERPMEAIMRWENMAVSGIQFLLKNSKLKLTIPCHVGNHTRITKRIHVATEQENSLEFFAYNHLANYFKGNERVTFLISKAYHSYVDVYNYTIRFHHGHSIKYGGGIGGLFIPAYKAISQWQKIKPAYLDCFGHFHQSKDGGNFICNGSNIGYNSYAVTIKADFEKPKQQFFLIDKKRGKTGVFPICYDV